MHRNRGFSLLELMIAVAIVGIIASIAYPSYLEYVSKSRRADAQAALVSFAGAMERYYTVNNTYVGTASGAVPAPPIPSVFRSEAPLDGDAKYYDLKIAAVSNSGFTLNAVPKNAQSGDSCGTLSLAHTGARGKTGTGDCWP